MTSTESLYGKLSAIMKGSPNSSDRDAGFCSGSSEGGDDLSMDNSRLAPRSPTDASEDSVEVKVTPTVVYARNKRKSTEPSKVICEQETGPLKKRIRYAAPSDDHFRPWNSSGHLPHELMPNPAEVFVRHPGVTTLHRAPADIHDDNDDVQDEPLALVAKKTTKEVDDHDHEDKDHHHHGKELLVPSVPSSNASSTSHCNLQQRPLQRNYKNMTRERRIEANARERTRVHTISAAYDTLRKSIPAYSNSQKLSKLSVLRVACSYILTLSRMAGSDYSCDQSEPSLADCIDSVTKTIQTEGKIRKKKDD